MKTSTGSPTKADVARFHAIQAIGRICCRKRGLHRECEIHHLLSGGRRIGHHATIGLCPWHHRGALIEGFDKQLSEVRGPSLARGSKPFHEAFGSDVELLAYQNTLLAERAAA